ncbi:hypothetical protein F5883DRAFT_577979 [Diaporthe sp. PMI_573]|nr:hypothetical protein F5883DRAFT_577979 [Diaporthaceae sp. PMI_573]
MLCFHSAWCVCTLHSAYRPSRDKPRLKATVPILPHFSAASRYDTASIPCLSKVFYHQLSKTQNTPHEMASEIHRLVAGLSKMQIAEFFAEHAPLSQEECNRWAEVVNGSRVRASDVQGATSYTVVPVDSVAGSVVQFRSPDYALDVEFLAFVERTYGRRFVPGHRNAGMLGMLHAYTMDNVHGISAYLAREQLRANGCRLLSTTVQDLASFFASAWHNTPPSMPIPDRGELYASYESQLQQLHGGLPVRFRATLKRLLKQLPELFAEDWPLVPNHTDLLENNIHVSPETGSITGICDWKDATVGPFGTSIEGLECLLGERTMKGWRWLANQMNLRRQFWQAFYAAMGSRTAELEQRIDTARLVGIFLTHGLVWVDAENRAPVTEGSSALGYLEAVTLGLEGVLGNGELLSSSLHLGTALQRYDRVL